MQDFWLRQVSMTEFLETLPRPSAALTAPPQRKQPVPRCFPPERAEPLQITRYSVVVEVSSHHLIQPVAGLLNRVVHAFTQFGCNLVQLRR